MAKKSLTLIMGMGPKGAKPEGDEDLYGSEKAAAGKALAAALKGGDGAEIAEAFEALLDTVAGDESPEPEMDESDESEESEEV